MRYDILSASGAMEFSDFIRPDLINDPEKEEFIYYIVKEDDVLLGMAVVDPRSNGPELLSIAVRPSDRGKGFGSGLLMYLKKDLEKSLNAMGDEGEETPFFALLSPQMDAMEDLVGFLNKNGFYEAVRSGVYRVKFHELLDNPILMKAKESSCRMVPLGKITSIQFYSFLKDLRMKGFFAEYDKEELDPDFSMFAIKGEKIIGCALFLKPKDNLVQNLWIYMDEAKSKAGDLVSMLKACVDAGEDKLFVKTEVSFVMANDSGDKLLKQLIPKVKPIDEVISYITLLYSDSKEYIDRLNAPLGLQLVSEDSMVCSGCRHCEEDVLSCAIYSQKPDAVIDGGECPRFDNK